MASGVQIKIVSLKRLHQTGHKNQKMHQMITDVLAIFSMNT